MAPSVLFKRRLTYQKVASEDIRPIRIYDQINLFFTGSYLPIDLFQG